MAQFFNNPIFISHVLLFVLLYDFDSYYSLIFSRFKLFGTLSRILTNSTLNIFSKSILLSSKGQNNCYYFDLN